MKAVFFDASYAIALCSVTDAHHSRATQLARRIEEQGLRLLTTRAVLLEIGNAMSRLRYRPAAVSLLEAIEQDPMIEIVALSEHVYARAFERFRARADKEWGITDCISFIVMEERSVTDALTADVHFRQAGFRALLLEESPA